MNNLYDEKRLNEKIDRINNDLQTKPFDELDIANLRRIIELERCVLNTLLHKLNPETEVETEVENKILEKQNLVYRYISALSYAQKQMNNTNN
jgi:hypothetical protein